MQDVTEIIGTGKVDLGFKAMIHTLAVGVSSVSYAFDADLLIPNAGQRP